MTQGPSEGAPASRIWGKFEELRLCVALWEHRLAGADHPWQRLCRDGAFAFRQICQNGLLVEAAEAVADGRPEVAIARLDTLAGIDPDHCVFDLVADGQTEKMAPHLVTCHDFLVALSLDPTWTAGADDLRAILGLNRFLGGSQPEGLALLDGVRWDRIRLPQYYLQKITLLYWSGAAEVVAAYLKALAPLFLDPERFDWGSRILGGVFGALSGEADFAGAVLESLLPLVLKRPELLFQVMAGLLFAGREAVLRAFFRTPGRLADLEGRLDREQRLRLYSLLFAAGCLPEAGQGFADLARNHDPAQLVELPQIVYGLVIAGREALADRLAQEALAGWEAAAGSPDVLPVAEALIQVGRTDRAAGLLAALSGEALADPEQAVTLFNLHERLSRPEDRDRTWPLLRRQAEAGVPAALEQVFWRFFYAGKLEEGLALVTEPGFGRRFGTGFPIRAAFLVWLGRFDEAALCLGERGYAGNGLMARERLLLEAMVHLANRDTAAALAAYRDVLALLDFQGPNLDRRWLPLPPVFEYLLLLRQLGRLDEAADMAAGYVRRYDVAGNPCRPLLALLTRELGRPVCSPEAEAGQCEQTADRLGNPRSYCQGWLYLRAAVLRIGLGQFAAADRLLQTKLAAVRFLDPATRPALRTAASTELASWREPLQAMFFPHFTDTYWNRLLDAVLAPVRGRTAEGGD